MANPRRKKEDEERSKKEPKGRKTAPAPVTNEEQEEMDQSDSVLLLKTDNILQAQFLVGALEEEEIPYVAKRLGLSDRTGGAITHVAYDAPGPAEVYVSPDDYDRAKELLDSLEGEGFESFDDEDEDEEDDEEEEFYDDDDER